MMPAFAGRFSDEQMAALLAYLHTGLRWGRHRIGAAFQLRRLNHGILGIAMASEKTFYLETFGCQMNAHDSKR